MRKTEAMMIAELTGSFLREYVPIQKTRSTHTVKRFEDTLALYMDFLGTQGITPEHLSADCFNVETIEKWLAFLVNERGNSPQTRNVRLSSLREFLKYLGRQRPQFLYLYVDARQIPRLPEIKRKVNGISKKAVKELLRTPNEQTRTGRRDIALMTTLYSTAGRLDEILSLKVFDLHLDDLKPHLRVIGKGSKARVLYLLPSATRMLKNHLQENHGDSPAPDAYVFYSRNTGIHGKLSQAAVDKMLKKHATTAHEHCPDVPANLHAHQLRHAKASHWLEDGMNIVQISFLLGHAQLETTMKYLDITSEEEMRALATLESEQDKSQEKLWKKDPVSLRELCGLRTKKEKE